MVFVKFHNMNRKKKFPNVAFKLKQTQKVSLYNKSKQYYNHSSKMLSFLFFFFFNLCTVYITKIVCSFFLFFFLFHMLCSTISSVFSFFFLFFFHLHCPVAFFFFLFSVFIFFFLFFFFRFIINCSFNASFFFNLISTSLCPYLNTITIGSLPSLFNFDLKYHKLSLIYNKTFSITYEHSSFFFLFFFFSLRKISRVFFFFKQPKLSSISANNISQFKIFPNPNLRIFVTPGSVKILRIS